MGQRRHRKSWLREAVVGDLHRNGPVSDPKGRAVAALAERLGHHSSMSVGNVVRELHAEGNAIRITAKNGEAPIGREGQPSPHPKRTYHIALTDEFIATLPPVAAPEPEPAVEAVQPPAAAEAEGRASSHLLEMGAAGIELPANIDYAAFTNAVMGVVWDGLQSKAKFSELRQELAEAKAALAEAQEVISALGAELKEERKQRGRIEDEAATLSAEVEDLEYKLRNGGRNNWWQNVPVDAFKQLDRIMREVPTVRG